MHHVPIDGLACRTNARSLNAYFSRRQCMIQNQDVGGAGLHAHGGHGLHHLRMGVGSLRRRSGKTHIGLDQHPLTSLDKALHTADQIHGRPCGSLGPASRNTDIR